MKAAEHRRQDRLRDAKRAIEAARKEQAQLIRTAARSVSDAEKAHKRAVAAAEDSVAKGEEGEALAACAPYTLFADQVYTPEGTVWLMPGMQATADASGNLQVEHRPTATRCCLCGCIPAFFLRKRETHDSRRLFISVSGPSVASVGQVRPSMERAARQFVAAFNAAAVDGPAARLRREGAIEEARQALQAARTDRSMVEEAERQVEEATSDTQASTLPRSPRHCRGGHR